MKRIKNKINVGLKKMWDSTKRIGRAIKRETNETYLASKILMKIAKGEEVTEEQIKFLKEQSIDFGKALALIGLQAIPGSSVAIVAIEKAGKKYGFTVFPKDQPDPEINNKGEI